MYKRNKGGLRGRENASEMTGDVVSLCAGGTAILPLASEAKVICALSTDVVVAEMVVERLRVLEGLLAVEPNTRMELGARLG